MCPDPVRKQAGFGLPLALFVITVLALLVVSMAQQQQGTGELRTIALQQTRAFYAAETAAQGAVNRLIPPDGSPGSCSSTSWTFSAPGLGGCQATVSCRVDNLGGNSFYTLNSTGTCGTGRDQARRRIEVRIQ